MPAKKPKAPTKPDGPDDIESAADQDSIEEVVTLAEPIDDEPSPKDFEPKTRPWWRHRWVYALEAVLLVLALVWAVKPLRLAALNALTSAKLEVTVIDQETKQPIQGVNVTGGSATAKTNEQGVATLEGLDFATTELTLEKEAYASTETTVPVDSRRETAGPFELKPTGTPVAVRALDKLTGEALERFSVQVKGTEAAAPANEHGEAVVNVPRSAGATPTLVVSGDGYNEAEFKLEQNRHDVAAIVELTRAGRHFFLSNRDGDIGVYGANLDGSDVELLVKGTGKETSYTQFYVAPDGRRAVLVSSRKGARDKQGEPLRELYVINLENGDIELGDEGADDFQVATVTNDRVVYVASYYTGKSKDRLKSINLDSTEPSTLYQAQELYGAEYQNGRVYIQRGEDRTYNTTKRYYTYLVYNLNDGQLSTVVEGSAQSYGFTNSDTHILRVYPSSGGSRWYQYVGSIGKLTRIDGRPSRVVSGERRASPDGSQTAWVEQRDGQGRVMIGNADGDSGKVVAADQDVNSIARWLDEEHLVFNVSTSDETADYLMHVPTGKTLRVTRVFNSNAGYYGF